MSERRVIRVLDTEGETDRQAWLERRVAWFAAALGLSEWDIECRWNGETKGEGCQAEVWPDPVHRASILVVTDSTIDGWAAHKDNERSAAHELVHLAILDYEIAIADALRLIDKKTRVLVERTINRYHERAVDRIARALVAAAHGDLEGEPPTVGRLVPRSDTD